MGAKTLTPPVASLLQIREGIREALTEARNSKIALEMDEYSEGIYYLSKVPKTDAQKSNL